MNAANAHSANLPLAIQECLARGEEEAILSSAMMPMEIDAIAVTKGPGMGASLSQGLSSAKLLSTLWDKPLIYVHHMVAHTLTPFLSASTIIKMPFLVLLLSGGHTQLVLCRTPTDFTVLATCNDDAIGDAFDKVARYLQIEFEWSQTSPGAALEAFASTERAGKYSLPVPFRKSANFSYSGVKTAVLRCIERDESILSSELDRRGLAYAFQEAAFAQIQDKIRMAFDNGLTKTAFNVEYDKSSIQDLVISGGVASNSFLRNCVQNILKAIDRDDVKLGHKNEESTGPS
ncbi:hypothetical protein CBS101457_004336 [Exobasidium rhododendri]|nr:hypothetical protein CBS101457_004336 [Exobasidium rhododendri]